MINKLSEIIKNNAKKSSGCSSDCVYLNSEKINIAGYNNLQFYSAQAGINEVKVTFSNYPYQYIFSTAVKEKIEDRKSFEKYGGLIYIIEPLTEELATLILSTLK